MPRGAPFTALCQQLAELQQPQRADLHVHSTASDGTFTPSQAVALAYRARLKAVALTDHDTLAGLADARQAANALPFPGVELVAGVEISTRFRDGELHLLGYFFHNDHAALSALLRRNQVLRRKRFEGFLARLTEQGVSLPGDAVEGLFRRCASVGRRHLTQLLVACGVAASHQEAWKRFIGPLSREVPPAEWPDVEEAIRVLHEAGGVSSLAHPPAHLGDADYHQLRLAGLKALEVVYPWSRSGIASRLRATAERHGFLVTGGSDCHGPEPAHRSIGSHGIPAGSLEALRGVAPASHA